MAVSQGFLDCVLGQLGAGLYVDGPMFALAASDTLDLKADDGNRALFTGAGARPFRPYAGRATEMPYYSVPAEVLEDPHTLAAWAREARAAALRQSAGGGGRAATTPSRATRRRGRNRGDDR